MKLAAGNPTLKVVSMEIDYSSEAPLSASAMKLVNFDVASIRRVVQADRGTEPDLWLALSEGYESRGHILRDSGSIRLIAYLRSRRIVYATDGCNACRHRLEVPLESSTDEELARVSTQTQLPPLLLARLADKLRRA